MTHSIFHDLVVMFFPEQLELQGLIFALQLDWIHVGEA
jgi:hypothetical protein